MRFRAVAPIVALVIAAVVPAARAKGPNKDPLAFDKARVGIMLDNVSKEIAKLYYDPNMRGLDWAALTAQAHRQIDEAGSVDEMFTAVFRLVGALKDSHTMFIPPAWTLEPEFGFDAGPVGDAIRVLKLKPGGAAEAAGLLLGDRIVTVNGFAAMRDNFWVMMIYFHRLRPVPRLDMTVERNGQKSEIAVQAKVRPHAIVEDLNDSDTLNRYIREADDAELENPATYSLGDDGVGYIHLPYFPGGGGTREFFSRLMRHLKGARAVIVDLRGNPGGAIEGLSALASHFTTAPASLAEEAGRSKTESIQAQPAQPGFPGRLVVLVDGGSASSSEVFARFAQLSGHGVVVGDTTAGMVMVSLARGMTIGGASVVPYGVQISIARAVLPGGEELEGKGVTPDRACVPTEDDLREKRDPCRALAHRLAAAPADASPPAH
jgi:carboxyl-terminal processing protease